MAVGTDVMLDPADLDASFAPGRNFANKLWNIGRLLLGHLDGDTPRLEAIPADQLDLADRWILARSDAAIEAATAHYARFGTGYRAGGFSPRGFDGPAYDPEKAKVYEIGIKSEFFDRRLRANVSLFRTDYSTSSTSRSGCSIR